MGSKTLSMNNPHSTPRPDAHLIPIMLGSAAFIFLNFGLPIYTRSLGANAVAIGGMYTAFTVTMLLLRPLVGWALDHYGRRRFFVSAFVFYCISMAVFSQSTTLIDFYIARALQGVGASLMWISARTMVSDLVDGTQRGQQMGRITVNSVRGSMLGAFYGFTLLGMMPIQEAWSYAFAGYSVAALLGLILASRRVTETAPEPTPSHTAVAVPVQPAYKRLLIIVFLSGFAGALIEPIYLIYLQDKFQLGLTSLALAFFPAGIIYAILPQYAGAWSDRLGRAPVIVAGILIAGLVSLALPWMPHILWVAGAYTISAIGWSMANPAEDALLSDLAPAAQRGQMFGYKEAAFSLGAALGPLTGGAIYEYVQPSMAFVANGAVLAIAALLTWIWFRSPTALNPPLRQN